MPSFFQCFSRRTFERSKANCKGIPAGERASVIVINIQGKYEDVAIEME